MTKNGPSASDKPDPIASSGFFVLRAPALPFSEFQAWSDGLEAKTAGPDPALLERALAADRARLRGRLRELVERPAIRDALFVASPDLDLSLELWVRDPESERGGRVERALVRYFSRMAGRATPFGLFAGCSVGSIGDRTRLVLEPVERSKRHSRLDMDYLFALVEALSRDRVRRDAYDFRPNSSLYRAGGRVHYVEARLDGKERSHHLVAIEDTDGLRATLARAGASESGSSAAALAAALVDDDVTPEEALEYVGQLIDGQILRPALGLRVTGDDPMEALATRLVGREETAAVGERLKAICADLSALDAAGPGADPGRYREIAGRLQELPAPVEMSRLFQVDMTRRTSEATLGAAVLDEIVRGVDLLRRLAPPRGEGDLQRFLEAFTSRYEEREVSLVEALDAEVGIGFPVTAETSGEGEPLLAGLELPGSEAALSWRARDEWLLRRLTRAVSQGAKEIILTDRDVERLTGKKPNPLPGTFAVLASVAAASEEALDRGDFRIHLSGCDGPSGARLLGRFCLADPQLRRLVEQHLRADEALDPDAVFAEVVHLPEGRLGNILLRPVFREYEIPYLGTSGAPSEKQIPITDLLVSASGDRLVLRSARLGRRVVPRLTSAHNFHFRGLPLYRFLCEMQTQDASGFPGWDWGTLSRAPFLPRVSYASGRFVLSPARWNLEREELEGLVRPRGAERFRAVQSWRAERSLPRYVLLVEGDNRLPVDLDNVLSIESFVSLLKDGEEAAFVEMLPSPEELCARGPEGRFVHELVVPFVRTANASLRAPGIETNQSPSKVAKTFPRRFPPGSEWIYAKLYGGVSSADRVLRESVAPIVRDALATGSADRWFFVRYADPEPHLRVRLHGSAARLTPEVLPALHAALAPALADGRLWKVQLDTYEREVERYGGAEGIEIAEGIFHADSEAVLEMLEQLEEGDEGAQERWRLALRGIDSLLDDFGLDLPERIELVRRVRESLGRELDAEATLKHPLGGRYRKEYASLRTLLDRTQDEASGLAPGFEVFRLRSERLVPLISRLRASQESGLLSRPIPVLLGSYVHMHVNRLLRSGQRVQELVLYDFLRRLYGSQAAVGQKEARQPPD